MCQHPNIIKLIDLFENSDYYYIVLELIEGGELFERIQKKDHYSERDARLIMQQLASAMAVAMLVGRYVSHAIIVNTLALVPPKPSIFDEGAA